MGPWFRLTRYGLGPEVVNLAIAAAVAILAFTAAAAEPIRILALGDSLVAGYGLARDAAFPAQLERALRARGFAVSVVNAGVSGDTSAGGLARLEWALAERPAATIVAFGGNDGLRGLDPAATLGNLDAMVTRLKARGVRVLLAGMKAPPNLGREYGAEFAAVFPRLAERHRIALYPFFLEGVAADPALNQADGIHPNAIGVAAVVERILPAVVKLITERDCVGSA